MGTDKIRIAHFIETDVPGGAEKVLLEICKYLKENASECFEPLVLTFSHPWFKRECAKAGIEYHEVKHRPYFKRIWKLPVFAWKFADFLKELKVGLLHSHLYGPVCAGSLAASKAEIPHVATLHDTLMIEEKPVRRFPLMLAGFTGSSIVTVSKSMQDFYETALRVSSPDIATIYNGLDIDAFSPLEPQTLSLPTIKIIVLGRLVKLKQVDKVIQVCESLGKQHDLTLEILGDGPELEYLKAITGRVQNLDIRFSGRQENPVEHLRNADIFVQNSTTEGLSKSIIEASACGLPCVVTNVGGNSEIVEDEGSGYLVNANDSSTLYTALKKLIENPNIRRSMGRRGRELVSNKFDAKRNYLQYMHLYSRLLGYTLSKH